MKFFGKKLNISFLKYRKPAFGFSIALLVLTAVTVIAHGGLNYGIDFAGGTLIQLKFKGAAPVDEIRRTIDTLGLGAGGISEFGEPEDVILHIPSGTGEGTGMVKTVKTGLEKKFWKDSFSVERVEMVGPKVGKDLSIKAILSLTYALIGILIYVSYRFEFRFAMAAVVALAHDTIITVGAFSLLGKEFTLPVVAALLTVIGYSLNDTIVVFDRVRENLRLKRAMEISGLVDLSINQTLGRTIITSGTTLIVVLAIFIFGGSVIHDFSFALLVGIVIGTYSSIFVASPILLAWPGTTTQSLGLAVKKR